MVGGGGKQVPLRLLFLVRTIFTDSWSIVIQGTTIHLLIQHLNLTEMRINRAIDSLKHALIDRLLQVIL